MYAYVQLATNARRRYRTAVLRKLRELRAADLAYFAGLAAHAQDLGEFPQLLNWTRGARTGHPDQNESSAHSK